MKCHKCKKEMEEDKHEFRCKKCRILFDKGFEEWFCEDERITSLSL